jgi:hypothetical protein
MMQSDAKVCIHFLTLLDKQVSYNYWMRAAQKSTQQMKIRSKEFNWDRTMEAAENMLRLGEILAPMKQEEERRKRKLKEFPKGYALEGSYTCSIC